MRKGTEIYRTFGSDTIVFKKHGTDEVLWEKPVNGQSNDGALVKAIQEFTIKHWDKPTPWEHSVKSVPEVYKISEAELKKHGTKLEGEELEKYLDSLEKGRQRREAKKASKTGK